MNKVCRIRMHPGQFGEYSSRAWDRGEVGIWYGGWTPEDLRRARKSTDGPRVLSESTGHQPLRNWSNWGNVSKSYFNTAVRFADIPEEDWALMAFPALGDDKDPTYWLSLGHLDPELLSDEEHPFNLRHDPPKSKELFKFRRLRDKKKFRLSKLPEVFRLIPQTGRLNVFQYGDLNTLVSWLVDARCEEDVWSRFRELKLVDLIHALGPKGWEALAEAHLIIQEHYVPVGLVVGKTLKSFDLLGRSLRDGASIVASCKNNRRPVPLPAEFREAVVDMSLPFRAYFFAYGGCSDSRPPDNVKLADGETIVRWMENTEPGRRYRRLLVGE